MGAGSVVFGVCGLCLWRMCGLCMAYMCETCVVYVWVKYSVCVQCVHALYVCVVKFCCTCYVWCLFSMWLDINVI